MIALISAASAAAIAVFASWRTNALQRQLTASDLRNKREIAQLESKLARDEKDYDRKLTAEAAVKQYRELILIAADDLAERIDNIRNRGFLVYLNSDPRRSQVAVLSTLYRFAVYLGWVHVMESRAIQLRFAEDENTRGAVKAIREVGRTLSSDSVDWIDGRSRLMLWREEQRAIGGLMRLEGQQEQIIGFEAFVGRYEGTFNPWMQTIAQDLSIEGIAQSERLEQLQTRLRTLTSELNIEGLLSDRD